MEGIACVRAPRTPLPQLSSDGLAPSELEQPSDVTAYVNKAIELIADEDERRRSGKSAAAVIRQRHTGSGWLSYLRSVEAQLPSCHSVYQLASPEPLPLEIADFWTQFVTERMENSDPLNAAYRRAITFDLKPKMDSVLVKAVRCAKHVRGQSAVHEALLVLSNPVLSLLSSTNSGKFYDKIIRRLCHDGRIMDACRWVREGFSRRLGTVLRLAL